MKRQNYGYPLLAALLLIAPACGQSGDPSGAANRRDQTATERAGQQTNETAPATPRADTPSRNDNATGTTGSVTRSTEDSMGLGPDAAITMKIQAKYAGDDVVKGRNIDVDTDNGVVTLKGSVDSAREKQAAEQIARQVEGVQRVVNELKVGAR